MVLLTSSQVNVAISSGIVVLFTLALFLSGYAIQQRTVKHLRAAIRPDNTPQLYLPDRFHDETTELEDGTIVMLDEYNRPVRMKNGRISIGPGEPLAPSIEENNGSGPESGKEDVIIEIQETLPEVLGDEDLVAEPEQQQQQQQETVEETAAIPASGADGQDIEVPQEQEQQPPEKELAEKPQQPQLSPEQQALLEGVVPNPDDANQKPISRAERRRLIKEEIARLSQGEQPVYYQRRLW